MIQITPLGTGIKRLGVRSAIVESVGGQNDMALPHTH